MPETEASTEPTPAPKKRAPGPRGAFLLGSLPEMQRKGQLPYYYGAWKTYGDVVRFKMGPLTQHLFARPEAVKHILVSNKDRYCKGIAFAKLKLTLGAGLFVSEGELWRRQRRLMQPPFTAKGVTQFTRAITGATEGMLARWAPLARDAQPIDCNHEMMRLAMDVVAQTMFGSSIGEEVMEIGRAFAYVLEFVASRTVTILDVPLFVPTSENRRFNRSMRMIETFIQGIVDKRRSSSEQQDDLLSILLHARDEENGQGMSEKQLRDEILTIFFAGHETTAQALTWTWYLLSQHPEVERELEAEIDRVLSGRPPALEDLPRLEYARMVVEEAMRLYPPVWIFARDALEDDEIDGYPIRARSMVLISQYITHRHPEFWRDPERFDPERFSAKAREDIPRYAYFPFGAGPRTCIGNHFALLETQLVVAMIAQRYRLELGPGVTIEAKAVATLRPNGPVPMILRPR